MRTCGYRHCDVCIDEMRPNALYCYPEHKARENHLLRAEGRGSRRDGAKPDKTGQDRPRRANRDGVGTRLYVVDDEVALVRDLLSGKRRRPSAVHARLLPKVLAAADRLDGRSAA
jgi:hypothetical protein